MLTHYEISQNSISTTVTKNTLSKELKNYNIYDKILVQNQDVEKKTHQFSKTFLASSDFSILSLTSLVFFSFSSFFTFEYFF